MLDKQLNNHPFKGGLRPPKKEYIGKRRFSYSKYFGAPLPIDVPDFIVSKPIKIKNQGRDGTCVAFSLSAVSEDQEGVEIEPAYIWHKISQLDGYNPTGADPDIGCKVLTKFGSLSVESSPYHLPADGSEVAIKEWDSNLDKLAEMQKKKSYFEMDGSGDMFDNIRQVLFTHQNDKITAFAGIYWQPSWSFNKDGICEHFGKDKSCPHAIKIHGQKTINGVPYLVVQNSWGEQVGDGGMFYFSREVANKLMFARGFFDVSPDDVKQATWGVLTWLKDWVIKLLNSLKMPQETTLPQVEPTIVPPTENPVEVNIDKIIVWAEAIKAEEGWFPGSRSYRNNNPGNLKWSILTDSFGASIFGKNATILGATKDSLGFAVYPTYEIGFNALCEFLKLARDNKLKDYHDKTLKEFTQIYAEPPVSHPYTENVARKLKVDVNIKIKNIV